jgi:hypothetical protein
MVAIVNRIAITVAPDAGLIGLEASLLRRTRNSVWLQFAFV